MGPTIRITYRYSTNDYYFLEKNGGTFLERSVNPQVSENRLRVAEHRLIFVCVH